MTKAGAQTRKLAVSLCMPAVPVCYHAHVMQQDRTRSFDVDNISAKSLATEEEAHCHSPPASCSSTGITASKRHRRNSKSPCLKKSFKCLAVVFGQILAERAFRHVSQLAEQFENDRLSANHGFVVRGVHFGTPLS